MTEISRRDFLKTGAAAAAGATVLGFRPEAAAAQSVLTDYSFFTRKDFEQLGLRIAPADVEQNWKGDVHPEIATVKDTDGSLIGVEISVPLAVIVGGNEASVIFETAEGYGRPASGDDPAVELTDYKKWFDPKNPEQEAKEKIARMYLVDRNGSEILRNKVKGGAAGVYKNPGSARNIYLFAGSPWLAEEPKLTVRIGNVSVEAAADQTGGVILKNDFVKSLESPFKVNQG